MYHVKLLLIDYKIVYNAFSNVYCACEKKEIIYFDLNGMTHSHNAITMIQSGFLLVLGAQDGFVKV